MEQGQRLGGISGIFLWVIDLVGRLVLLCLVGRVAAKETPRGRWARILAGSLAFAALLGWLWTLKEGMILWTDRHGGNIGFFVFLVVPAICALEFLRQNLAGETFETSQGHEPEQE